MMSLLPLAQWTRIMHFLEEDSTRWSQGQGWTVQVSDTSLRKSFQRRVMRQESDAAHDALVHVEQNWYKKHLFRHSGKQFTGPGPGRRTPGSSFFIRLFSTFKTILKGHMTQHHSQIMVPEEARAVWLIDRGAQRQNPLITTTLARLNKFVDHQPEPR